MSTQSLVESPLEALAEQPVAAPPSETQTRAPTLLAAALLLLTLYTAFAHGATSLGTGARIQVAIAAVALLAGSACIWSGALRFRTVPLAGVGVALLAAFAAWSGATLAWSVAPDQTWVELNRTITYVIVLALAILLGASDRRALERVAGGFLIVALAVTVYALGQKLLPGLHVAGVFDLNQTTLLPRLQEPFGYWNALALFIAIAVPTALLLASDRDRSPAARVGALIALQLMLLTLALTYSRGGLIAVVVALAVGIAASGAGLRALMWLAVGCLALVAPLVVGLTDHSLTATGVPLGDRESAGVVLLGVLLASLLALGVCARWLFALERTIAPSPARVRGIGRLLAGLVALAAVAGVLAVALSSRGLTGSVSHVWKSFTTPHATSVYEPTRLLSAASENRWVWWKEAAGAFGDRPLTGWGAGSFPVVHLLYRRDTLPVSQPHSVPLQFLAETGVVGALAALLGLVLLLAAAVRFVARLPGGRPRLVASALLAGAVAYLVHALYDWDWDIPGVTFPALLFLGVLVGVAVPGERRAAALRFRPGPGLRILGLVTLTLCACAFAASAALPSLAADKAGYAVVAAASGSPREVQRAQAAAALATKLDPLSDAGLQVEATIASRRGQLRQARSYLLQALGREPTDGAAWRALAIVEWRLGRPGDAIAAAARVQALDPRGIGARVFTGSAIRFFELGGAPPQASPTAQP